MDGQKNDITLLAAVKLFVHAREGTVPAQEVRDSLEQRMQTDVHPWPLALRAGPICPRTLVKANSRQKCGPGYNSWEALGVPQSCSTYRGFLSLPAQ